MTNPGFIAFGKHNSYPSMKGIIYEARFSLNSIGSEIISNYINIDES